MSASIGADSVVRPCPELMSEPPDGLPRHRLLTSPDDATSHRRGHAGTGEEEVHRFVEGLIGNYLLGAPDAHAKNYSVILAPNLVALAPLYDIASGLPYEHRGEDGFPSKNDGLRKAAMAIGGEGRFGRVERRHWSKFAADANIDEEWLVTTVGALASIIPDALDEVIDEEHEAVNGSDLPDRLLKPIKDLCDATVRLLAM